MNTCFVILSFILCGLLCVLPVHGDDTNVVILTDDNFDEVTAEGSWLIEFYAPWCGHCKKLAPIYDEASVELRGKLNLGKVDCTSETKTATRFGVKSYPTLKFKRGDEMRPYTGPRTYDGIVAFGEEMNKPPITVVTKLKSLEKFEKSNPVTFVLFANAEGPAQAVFLQSAFAYQGLVKFVHIPIDNTKTEVTSILTHYSLSSSTVKYPFVLSSTKGGDNPLFTNDFEDEELRAYIHTYRSPLIHTLEGGNFEELTSTQLPLVLIITVPEDKKSQEYIESLYTVAKYFKGKFTFATVDGIKFSKYVEQFNIYSSSQMPTITVLDYPDYYYSYKDLYGDTMNMLPLEKTSEYLQSVLDGKVPATGTIPWYNPARYLKIAERYLSKLSIPALVAIALVGVAGFLGIIFAMCKCLGGFDDLTPQEQAELEKQQALAAEDDANDDTATSTSSSSSNSSTNNIRKRDNKSKARRAD